MFKKRDLTLTEDDSKSDEAELAVSSPTVEVTKSEVSLVTKTEDVKVTTLWSPLLQSPVIAIVMLVMRL